MDKDSYNIFGRLQENIEDFDKGGFYIIGKPTANDEYSKDKGKKGGYYYSQKDTLEACDLAMNSKFKDGVMDAEGKKKAYKNIVNFYKDVALNNINVNVHNYILEPTLEEFVWPVFLMDRRFKEWAVDEDYDDEIDALAEDYVGKGTCVTKIVGECVERVPLRTLRCSQGAKSLKQAGKGGGYVILEHNLSLTEIEDNYKDWKTDGLEYDKTYTIYERYSLVPLGLIKLINGSTQTKEDWKKRVLAVQVLCPDVNTKKDEKWKGKVLFIEEIDEVPLEEAHYEQIDGRWLGRGEVEKQLENQIAINFTTNLRRRSLLWATKKLFQSTDDEVVNNLVMEVKDGAVIRVKPNGQLTEVNSQTQHLADFAADEAGWIQNAQQKAFAFESATGESMPSGTPFRLGVILEKSVSKYFKRKQDTFSNYLKRSFFNQIIEIFKKDNKDEHTLIYSISSDRFDQIKDAFKTVKTNQLLIKKWMNKDFISREEAESEVDSELIRSPYLFIKALEGLYDRPEAYIRLNINEPIASEIESLTSFYTLFSNKNDPRAEAVLRKIAMKQGNNLDYILSTTKPLPEQQMTPNVQPNQGGQPATA